MAGDPGKPLRKKATVTRVLQCLVVMAKSVVMDPPSAVGFDIEQRMPLSRGQNMHIRGEGPVPERA